MAVLAVTLPRRRWVREALGRAGALPLAIGVLALALRLYGLADKPFWLDEITSLHRATATVPHLVADSLQHKHYPSYFLLLWLVARLGTSPWLLRLPSAIFGAANAALTCAIGRRVAGSRSGAIAGLLMAFSPFAVQLGQDARSYTLVLCLILVALWGLVRLAEQPAAAGLPLRQPGSLRAGWIAYGLGTAAALDVLNVAVAWLLAANLAAAAIAWRAGPTRRGFVRKWGAVQAIILAVWLPFFALVDIASKGAVLHGVSWAPAETPATVWSVIAPVYLLRISRFVTYELFRAAVPGLGLAVAALAVLGAWRLRRKPVMLAAIGCPLLMAPLGLLALSTFVPVLVPRYFAWSAAPFCILAGAGLGWLAGRLAGRRLAAGIAALAAVCVINLLPYYRVETKPRWDLLAKQLAAEAQPGDVVLLNSPDSLYMFSAFAKRLGIAARGITMTRSRGAAVRLAPGHRIWAVYGRAGQGPMTPPSAYLRSLASLGQPSVERSVGHYIVVWRFDEPNGLQSLNQDAPSPAEQRASSCGGGALTGRGSVDASAIGPQLTWQGPPPGTC